MNQHHTFSSAETRALGKKLAEEIPTSHPRLLIRKGALIFALTGELGSGKTTFVQGFLRGLGVRRGGASPTFIIFRRFMIYDLRFKNVYHVDAYRLKNSRELATLGFKEILADPENIVLIEWAEKIKKLLPRSTIKILFSHGEKSNERAIKMKD